MLLTWESEIHLTHSQQKLRKVCAPALRGQRAGLGPILASQGLSEIYAQPHLDPKANLLGFLLPPCLGVGRVVKLLGPHFL